MLGANTVPPNEVATAGRVTTNLKQCVDDTLKRVGKQVVLALPLGLGKANYLANEFYARAKHDERLSLHIVTALTLEVPQAPNDLGRRFLEPVIQREYGQYPPLDYATDRRNNNLPPNVQVTEFFLTPGSLLGNSSAQHHYINSNYTHATRDLLAFGVNVVAQMIAPHPTDAARYSLSCNTDITLDLIATAQRQGQDIVCLGEVNQQLPFMPNDAEVPLDYFTAVFDPADKNLEAKTEAGPVPGNYGLFTMPQASVTLAEHAIGMHAASLVVDGGTLQIGIGALGDAVCHALLLRQQHSAVFCETLAALNASKQLSATTSKDNSDQLQTRPFSRGLYACSEMLVEGFLHLHEAGIVKRRVFMDETLQQLLNTRAIDETVTPELLHALLEAGRLQEPLSDADIKFLIDFGIFDARVKKVGDYLLLPSGKRVCMQLSNPDTFEAVCTHGLGERLKNGFFCHAGFYLGSQHFYDKLTRLPDSVRQGINMTRINYINHLYGAESLKRSQRHDARFINSGMMVTLSGAVVSDGLESQQVVSGIGGQYNFVAQAHELKNARSIICLPSTRVSNGEVSSTIVWNYGHQSIPRHLRDIVITEYGIANLRGQSDRDVIARLLEITDSRFQQGLLAKAIKAAKIEADYKIPRRCQHNSPETIARVFAQPGRIEHFPYYPLDCDWTESEAALVVAIKHLKQYTKKRQLFALLLLGWRNRERANTQYAPYLKRLDLHRVSGIKTRMTRLILIGALAKVYDSRRCVSGSQSSEVRRVTAATAEYSES